MSKIDEAREYEAKAKALRREEKAFWNEVEKRLDEVDEFIKKVRQKKAYMSDTITDDFHNDEAEDLDSSVF